MQKVKKLSYNNICEQQNNKKGTAKKNNIKE